ncbi:unnamed protein product, partial [Symbiodinium necroappetens]
EVQLRGGKLADSELDRWKAQALIAPEPDVPAAAAPREIVPSFRGQDQSAVQKEAMARLVRSFVRGRALEVSSLARGAGSHDASFDRELSEMRLKPLTAEGVEWAIPFLYVLDAVVELPPGISRYSLPATVRIRLAPHAGHGPDTVLLQLANAEEGQAMSLFLRASSKHLQRQASWHRDR